ncbi:MAG TPA: nucleotide exchange factor GrpE [Aestuariivirgaceae bacterium]|nr:nucleotide exchange factor GrpE [Aestuariivirgaceae bacterium]
MNEEKDMGVENSAEPVAVHTEGAEQPVLKEESDPLKLALQAVDALKEENAQLKDKLLRTLADMENLRKRLEREKAEATLYAASNFARDLLSVADNFSRALAAVTPEQRTAADEMSSNLLAGIEVTERELTNVLERHGIRRIDAMGQKFDPHMHQAIFEVPTADHPAGTVVQVMQNGYAIGTRCLRPALVGVAKAPANDP